jgi:hypothetical protein
MRGGESPSNYHSPQAYKICYFAMRKPELRPVTESSRAETAALLLGEDLRSKQDQADRCA